MAAAIRLIVGLANPGTEYEKTRHNAGAWFVQQFALQEQLSFKHESKFSSLYTNFTHLDERVHILIPTTYMNHSGQAVRALVDYYKISPENMLVAHDELDLAVGDIRLKLDGGHGGHNGLRDICAHLHSNGFYRLRIGIGHPGQRHMVTDYVLSAPSKSDKMIIEENFIRGFAIMPYLLDGANEKAMQLLHTK
jgi:peptidyl-tRNA hydrolase, PTH1 family